MEGCREWNWHLVQGSPETGNSLGCRAYTQFISKTRSPQLDTSIRPAECEALVGTMGHGSQTWVEEGAPGLHSSSCRSRSRPSHHGSRDHAALVLRGVQGNAGCEWAKMKDFSTTLDPTASGQQVNNNKDGNSDRSPCRSETVRTSTVYTFWGLEAFSWHDTAAPWKSAHILGRSARGAQD